MVGTVDDGMASSKRLWSLSLIFSLLAGLGLAYVVWNTDPALTLNRLAFLGLLFVAVLALLSPLAHYLHFRFTPAQAYRDDPGRSLREGGLAAAFVTLCAWLRMGEALNWINALLILSALVLVEALILLRGS
jgi:hypothetical protein